MNSRNIFFLKMAALMLIATAFTTLVAHLVNFPTDSFDEQILLYQNTGYHLRNDAIIIHCLFVIVSMLGLGILEAKNHPGWIGLGFLCFVIFSIAEIARMTLANIMVTSLREQYHFSSLESVRDDISFFLQSVWPEISTVLFMIFILAFSLGCICYGIAFSHRKWVGLIFTVWGGVNLLAFINAFVGVQIIDDAIGFFSSTYQPFARLFIGIWFWRTINLEVSQTGKIRG